MSRLIFLFVIVAVVYKLLKPQRKDTITPVQTEDMVCCAHCGLNFPAIESIMANNQHFCSVAHRNLHPLH
jgi:uncharacterized protein